MEMDNDATYTSQQLKETSQIITSSSSNITGKEARIIFQNRS